MSKKQKRADDPLDVFISPTEARAAFMWAARGLPAHETRRVIKSRMTEVDWTGATKSMMAEEFVKFRERDTIAAGQLVADLMAVPRKLKPVEYSHPEQDRAWNLSPGLYAIKESVANPWARKNNSAWPYRAKFTRGDAFLLEGKRHLVLRMVGKPEAITLNREFRRKGRDSLFQVATLVCLNLVRLDEDSLRSLFLLYELHPDAQRLAQRLIKDEWLTLSVLKGIVQKEFASRLRVEP